MPKTSHRRLPASAYLYAAIGRIPFDRVDGELTRRTRQDANRILFKRSFEQRINVHEEPGA